jgi:DNA primase
MNNSEALLSLLESVLGAGKRTSKGNYAFFCPFCSHKKRKLEIQIETDENGENRYHCWTCPVASNIKGRKISTLLKKLEVSSDKLNEAKLLTRTGKKLEQYESAILKLPEEFISLTNTENIENQYTKILAKHALKYLKSRNITNGDILKYNIGFCDSGKYEKRIIIPSYDKNAELNYFIARSFEEDKWDTYKNPPVSVRDVIGFELYINWDAPIILCEGIFDALTIKRNVIPLFGKVIHNKLKEKLVKSSVDRIYVVLDQDAIKDAIKHCEELMSYGKEVYLLNLYDKDPNKLGAKKMLELLEEVEPLTFQSLMLKKLEII